MILYKFIKLCILPRLCYPPLWKVVLGKSKRESGQGRKPASTVLCLLG